MWELNPGADRPVSSVRVPLAPTNWRPVAAIGLCVTLGTFVVFGAWAAVARLDSAAVAGGTLSTLGNIKTVQHLEGGIVADLKVINGSRVRAGDLLIRLDTTQTEANLTLFKRQLAAAKASAARLEAEESLATSLVFPDDALAMANDNFVNEARKAESARFNIGRDALAQQIRVLESQIEQIQSEIATREAEATAATQELDILDQRLVELRKLDAKGLVMRNELLELQRDTLNLRGRVAIAASEINRAHQRIAENKLKTVQLQQQYRQLAANALPELRKEIRELERQLIVATDMLSRVELRAPVDGIVQELKIFTVGAVIQPGEPLMNIAPEGADEGLIVRANVSPLDADSVLVGMDAEVQFPAFMSLNLMPVHGTVVAKSGDRITDPTTNTSYFAVDVELDQSTVPAEIRNRLGAGLPANVVIPTGERTALAYLTDPLFTRLNLALRER